MPVKPVKDGDKWCIEDSTGKRHGKCHDSRQDALAQARAINANMNKETADSVLDALLERIAKWRGSRGSEPEELEEFQPEPEEKAVEETEPERPTRKTGLFTWKGQDDRWYWMARYSNSFRDNDNPPEIISSNSHKRFVDLVDKGVYPYPELWMWHEKAWKWGEATYVAFDEIAPGIGFAIAGGVVDKGKEALAERFAESPAMLVSHGMPLPGIVRDKGDPTIYLQHQTLEISPLPAHRAANKRTGFQVFTKENDMALSEEKRQEMANSLGIDEDTLREVEQSNAAQAGKAVEEGAEYKEAASDPPKEEKVPEQKDAYVTEKEFAAFTQELTRGFSDAMKVVKESLESLQAEVKSLRAEKEAEQKALTPAASLYATMMAAVDKEQRPKETLAESKPVETEVPAPVNPHNPGIPFINQMHVMNARAVKR